MSDSASPVSPGETSSDAVTIIPRDQHPISRKRICEHTLKVLYRLNRHGHTAYLVGGAIRDFLLDRSPKDFDVVTSATPDEIKGLFRNCFLVGRRFRLAHLRFGKELIEVATFRRKPSEEELPDDSDDHFGFVENVFGTPHEDAKRRDFTINALFYDIKTYSIIDHVDALKDLEQKRIKIIGNPDERFAEDPVRMLRAIEFSERLKFIIEEETAAAIQRNAPLIAEGAPARVREEMQELCRHRVASGTIQRAAETGLLPYLIPGYHGDETSFRLLGIYDPEWKKVGRAQEPLFVASLFISQFMERCHKEDAATVADALKIARSLITPFSQHFRIAKFISHQAREYLLASFRFERGRNKRGEGRFLKHPHTADSLRFYSKFCQARQSGEELAKSWHDALENPDQARPSGKKRRRRRPRRKPAPASS